jgi:hypothetical protein
MNVDYILGAKPVVFWSVVVGFFALATGVAILISRVTSACARRHLSDWAHRNGIVIVRAEEKHGKCGPFTWAGDGRGAKIFQIVARDAMGSTKTGWVRVMDEPEIIWDANTGA